MNTFPIRNDEYSVEEISYDDMMSILDSQKHISPDLPLDMSDTSASNDTHTLTEHVSKQDEFSQRIAENAKRQLPDWLLKS